MLLEDRLLVEVSLSSSSCLSQKDEVPMGGNAANMLLLVESPSTSSLCSSSSLSSLRLFGIEYSRVFE